MKLITFAYQGTEYVGVLTADEQAVRPLDCPDMNTLIETTAAADLAAIAENAGPALPLSEVELLAPIPRPRQDVICLGINYLAHAAESTKYDADAFGGERPVPIYFSKRVTEAVAPNGPIDSHPGLVTRLDYEAELAIIIGKTAKNVPAAEAGDYIFGYTILNDVSARMLQTTHKQWYFGKGLDGFTPMGPCILTADQVAFPPVLGIRCYVNDELRQNADTSLLITDIPAIIEELSSGMTLLPGTIIATGTPSGVGMGFDPPKFLQPGDVVRCEIDGIGAITNPVK